MMSLSKSKKKNLAAIFDASDPYENYPDKKAYINIAFWLQPQNHRSIHELEK